LENLSRGGFTCLVRHRMARLDDLGPRYAQRNGGYLRILKTGFRKGDNAPLALVTLMDRAEQSESGAADDKKSDKKSEKLATGAAKAAV